MILFIYSWKTQAEREAGSMQRARCGTQSWDSGITPWAKGRCSTTEPPRHPSLTTSAHKPMTSQLEGHFLCPLWCCKASSVLSRQTSSLLYSVPPLQNQGHLTCLSISFLASKLLFSFSFSVPREVYMLLIHITFMSTRGGKRLDE